MRQGVPVLVGNSGDLCSLSRVVQSTGLSGDRSLSDLPVHPGPDVRIRRHKEAAPCARNGRPGGEDSEDLPLLGSGP